VGVTLCHFGGHVPDHFHSDLQWNIVFRHPCDAGSSHGVETDAAKHINVSQLAERGLAFFLCGLGFD
jgi:hypothetical protein